MVDFTQYVKSNPRIAGFLCIWARVELGIAANGGLFTGP